ncbi:hypothetical protein ACJMK2_029785 [Sinanodonta woodiana]|uniref:Uncharacterized protein n=1 Tax=Sinanodonta woodiana TaxID=1069815 RepID=A0ABD3XB81_SINWO
MESHNCSLSPCPADGHWSSWSEWSQCPVTCGGNSQNRHRACNNPVPSNGGRPCVGSDMESQTCSLSACPVDGQWGIWSEWSKCPVTCGGNSQNRHRACNNPVPSNGGRSCVGSDMESQTCSLSACPVDGQWGIWSEWSKCPVTCGGNSQNRHRACNNPVPSNGGRSCVGTNMESQTCSLSACPVDGHWGSWSEWSQCPVTCGGNSQNRHRACNNPAPSNGGRSCVGSDMESQTCSLSACPVDGHWSSWSKWSMCPVTCGGNSQNRHRACNNPAPSNGGRPCVGSDMESQNCSLSACPVDGHWGSWSEWSQCPVTCGGNSHTRHRTCNNPTPSHGGRSCEGSHMESQNCSLIACPVDGKWSGWSEYSKCSVSCGLGTQVRSRSCSNPGPSNGGHDCVGLSIEALICSLPTCVPEPRVCDKVRLMSSISHNNSFPKNGNSSCTDPGYQPSRVLLQELCNAPSTSLHISSQVIDVCNQALAFSPVVKKEDTGKTEYGILIECHGNQLKVVSQLIRAINGIIQMSIT